MSQLAYRFDADESESVRAAVPIDLLAPSVSLFGNGGALDRLKADVHGAGLSVRSARPLESLVEPDGLILGDIVLVECGALDGARMASLIRLDLRAARSGASLVVSTTAESLEDVFGCLEASSARILVDPTAAQWALALGEALLRLPGSRVRELNEDDRLTLLRLTEEVGRLAGKLDRMTLPLAPERAGGPAGRVASPGRDFRNEERHSPQVRLPDPRLVQLIIRQRRLRERYFESELFADPGWDILLDLIAARAEHRRVSVTSLCIAAAVPATTALRWIAQMTDMGILVREQDEQDRRRAFVALSDKAVDAMSRYFDDLGRDAAALI